MAIATTDRKVQYDISAGPVTNFAITFKYFDETEIHALISTALGDVELVQGLDFEVTAPDDSGTFTRLNTWDNATLLTIYRDVGLTQDTVLTNGGEQDAEIYMGMVDRVVAMVQEDREVLERIVRFPITDPTTAADMPSVDDRKGQLLGFDNTTGAPIPVAAAVGSTVVSPFAVNLLDDINAQEAQVTLGLISPSASAPVDSTVQTLLESTIDSKAQTMLESGDIAGMTAGADDIAYDGSTIALDATTAQDAIETVGGVLKQLIVDAGLTYVASNAATLFKRACRAFGQRVGAICEFDDRFAPDADNPYLLLDSDQDILAANWPSLVTHLRGIKLEAGGATSWSYTASGGVMTLSGTGMTSLLADLAEDVLVHGSYTNWLTCTIGTTDYTITNVNSGSNQITVSVSPPSSGTVYFYPHRVPNDATKAREFKDQGRAIYSHDGSTYLAGLRRRDREQGHWHRGVYSTTYTGVGTSGTGWWSNHAQALKDGTTDYAVATTPITDGTNGTPRTGPTTDAANSVKFRYRFGGIYLP